MQVPIILSFLTFFFFSFGWNSKPLESNPALQYKLKVDEVSNAAEAKILLEKLSHQDWVVSYAYIEECNCFKIESNVAFDFAGLKEKCELVGYTLIGVVDVGDGSKLNTLPQSNPSEE